MIVPNAQPIRDILDSTAKEQFDTLDPTTPAAYIAANAQRNSAPDPADVSSNSLSPSSTATPEEAAKYDTIMPIDACQEFVDRAMAVIRRRAATPGDKVSRPMGEQKCTCGDPYCSMANILGGLICQIINESGFPENMRPLLLQAIHEKVAPEADNHIKDFLAALMADIQASPDNDLGPDIDNPDNPDNPDNDDDDDDDDDDEGCNDADCGCHHN